MCMVEEETHLNPNGRPDTVERTYPCRRVLAGRRCKGVERRRIVRIKPSSPRATPEPEGDGFLVTQDSRGRERMYRDLGHRSGNTASVRRSATMRERSPPVAAPSSATSPSDANVGPAAPSPPRIVPGVQWAERTRAPYAFAGPRASFDSTTAEVDAAAAAADGPTSRPRRRHPPSVPVDTAARPPTPSSSSPSPVVSSPGLSRLKGILRRDSGKAMDRPSGLEHRPDPDRRRRREREREGEGEKEGEDDRQARLERARLAASDRREHDRQRFRAATVAAAALEGATNRDGLDDDDDDRIRRGRDAERAEMSRERAQGARLSRRLEGDEGEGRKEEFDDPASRWRYRTPPRTIRQSPSRGPIVSARAFRGDDAVAAREPRGAPGTPDARSVAERGEAVVARERARVVEGRRRSGGGFGEVVGVEGEWAGEDGRGGSGRRRKRERVGGLAVVFR